MCTLYSKVFVEPPIKEPHKKDVVYPLVVDLSTMYTAQVPKATIPYSFHTLTKKKTTSLYKGQTDEFVLLSPECPSVKII